MTNYLITGVSSGIGRELAKRLVEGGDYVIGVARRKELLKELKKELKESQNFNFISADLSRKDSWKKIVGLIHLAKFIPDIIIFNAAIFEKDYLNEKLNFAQMRRSFEINFFSVLKGFEALKEIAKPKTQFIFISTSSALKGSGAEGVGYPASKSALSIAFESLYQKYKSKYCLKIIYFGPIRTEMLPSLSIVTPVLSKNQAVEKIVKVIHSKKVITYTPWYLFLFLKLIKILPGSMYLTIISLIDILHLKSHKK